MRKVSDPFKRTGHKTWWIRWYDGGHKRHKSFQAITEARMYQTALYQRLNSDVYTNIDLGLDQAIAFFADHNKAQNLAKASMAEYASLFSTFRSICPETTRTSYISSQAVGRFATERLKTCSTFTVKKNLVQFKTFCKWLANSGYSTGRIVWPVIKTRQTKEKVFLSREQIKQIFNACLNEQEQLAVLVSLCTGLRASDVDSITSESIASGMVRGQAKKTGKEFKAPVPKFLEARLAGVESIRVRRKRWEKMLCGLCTRHDLRRTFAQFIREVDNIDVSSELLQHTSSRVTKEFYTAAVQKVLVERAFGFLEELQTEEVIK